MDTSSHASNSHSHSPSPSPSPMSLFMQASMSIDSLASNPRSSNFETVHRQQQISYLQKALETTSPPPTDTSENAAEYVPTSIVMAGPGNYGKKEIDEGNEVVLLNDDVLTSVANATVVIIDGNDLERISVLYQFPQFLEHCPQESINVMVPRICLEAVNWSPDAQMAAAEALYFVVNVTAPYRVANQVACAALQMTHNTSNIQVFDACGEIVSMILPQVHRYDVLQNIVPEAIDRAVSENPHQRRFAARIIGSLNDALDAAELEAIFIKTALNLSMDEDETVRALIAQSMASMGIKLPLRVSERMLWPRLSDLVKDDNCQVKAAAMRAMARSAEAHRHHAATSPCFDTLVKPVFLAECERAAEVAGSDLRVVNDDTYLILEIFSEVYGYFLCALADLFDKQNLWKKVLGCLRLMVTCNGPTVRHWCSFNMPAIASLCGDEKSDYVGGIIEALAGDSDVETRATLAAGIHEVTRSLRHSSLRNDVIRAVGMLFMDENAQVRMNALGHFSELLELLCSGCNPDVGSKGCIEVTDDIRIRLGSEVLARDGTDEEEMRRLAPMFSSLELMSFDSWRTQRLLAEEVEKCAHIIPQEMLCEHVAPLLFQMARESTFLVRKASMRCLIHVLRYVPDVRRRNHILKHFKLEWAHGKVYWTRLAFVEASECGLKVFSLKLFTGLFKDEVLGLKDDKVVNVRLRLLRFLRDMASVWQHLPEYRSAIDQLCADGDWQVSAEARELVQRLGEAVKPRGSDAIALDGRKERAEDAFFVHTNYKKRKGKGKRHASDVLQPEGSVTQVESVVGDDVRLSGGVGAGNGPQGAKSVKRPSAGVNNSALVDDGGGDAEGKIGRRRTAGRDEKGTDVGLEDAGGGKTVTAERVKTESEGKGGFFSTLCGCFGGG